MPSPQHFMPGINSSLPLQPAFSDLALESADPFAPELCLFRSLISQFGADRLFVPGYVPVPPEFAALLGEVGHALEAEPLMEPDRGRIRKRDAGVGPVYVLALEGLEQALVKPRPCAPAH